MTTATATPVFNYAAMRRTVQTDPSVTKVALICATFVITSVVGVLGWIASQAGDVGALSIAIGGVLTAMFSAVSALIKRRNGSGNTDA